MAECADVDGTEEEMMEFHVDDTGPCFQDKVSEGSECGGNHSVHFPEAETVRRRSLKANDDTWAG